MQYLSFFWASNALGGMISQKIYAGIYIFKVVLSHHKISTVVIGTE
jgi:hypothetical protein